MLAVGRGSGGRRGEGWPRASVYRVSKSGGVCPSPVPDPPTESLDPGSADWTRPIYTGIYEYEVNRSFI